VIDLFDWSVSRRVTRFAVSGSGWWVHLKYYLLAGILICALFGVLVSGFFAAIPVVTRGLLFITEPLQSGISRGWHQVPGIGAGQILSIALFLVILGLGLFQPRFWCRYVCPSGAVFSLSNLFRVTERKVETTCIHCNKCIEICPFDAIKPDFTTRVSDCTFCQSCGGVCPTHAIKFVERWNQIELKCENDPPTGDSAIGRRGFLSWAAGSTAALVGGLATSAAISSSEAATRASDDLPVRPPGSVPEQQFLQLCIRCGECFKVCPNNVLQAEGFQQGLAGLWAPQVVADWAGCESSCNACGQVCPTGAIRALTLEEKRMARMGLAIVNERTCLPFANREACQLCVDECNAAGYEAIEFMRVHTQVDSQGLPIDGSGYLAPVVDPDRCVGCGLCQTRCYGINVKTKQLLDRSAIVIEAGPGKEDRLMSGSYIELRAAESRERARRLREQTGGEREFFLPESQQDAPPGSPPESDDPFGL
jgi:NAD-dependent dihydropyrimidine dehydrogenase PreA subunit